MNSKSTAGLKTEYAVKEKSTVFFTGHQVQINKEGTHLFCQCSDNVSVIELSTGNLISKIELNEDEVTSLSLSPDNECLAVGFQSATLKYFDVKHITNPIIVTSIKSYHRGPVTAMCWDTSSTYLATGSSDGTARVWDLKQKFCTHSLKGSQGVFRVLMFDNDLLKRQWIFGAAHSVIYIWLLQAGESKLLHQLQDHTSSVTGMQLTHSGEHLISCGLDKVLIMWDLKTFSSVKVIPVFESLSGIILKPMEFKFTSNDEDENCILTIGNKGVPRVWNVEKGRELWRAEAALVEPTEKEVLLVNQFLLVPARRSVLIATYDHSIILFDLDTKIITKQLAGYNDDIVDVLFIGNGDTHLAVATNSPIIKIYDNETLNCHFVRGHTGNVLGLSKHPSESTVFGSCSHDNTAKIWRLLDDGSAVCVATASGHTHSVGSICLASGFMVTGSKDTCIKKWHFEENILTSSGVTQVTLSSRGTQRAHDKDINCVAISKNFSLIASSSQDKTAKVWDGNSLDLLGILKGHKKSVWCVQFSPVDCLLATASADGTVKVWTVSTYTNVSTLEGHEVAVLRLSWMSNGLQLVSTASDGLMKVWVVKDRLCINTFDEHDDRTFALAVASDGNMLATAGSDSLIVWWKDVTAEERAKKHEEVQRVIEEEQTMLNFLHKRNWKKALRFAIHLQQPFRALSTMKQLLDESPQELPSVLDKLKEDEISTLLEYTVQWNTKTRNVREAQVVINYILKERLPEEIESIPDWQIVLEGLLPYTEKHFKRIACLRQSAVILNYISSATLDGSLLTDSKMDEDLALLQSIPTIKGTGTVTENADVANSKQSAIGPVTSIEDTRENFVYEKVIAEDSEGKDNLGENSIQDTSDDDENVDKTKFFSEDENYSNVNS